MVSVLKHPKEIAKAIPESARVVLLGECTHGTEEFYDYRAEITKYLIDTRGFTLVCVEADWPYMWHINEYIHRRRTRMYPLAKRFPAWMWQNNSFANLIRWLRKGHDRVNLFGLDCYSKDESLEELLRFLDLHNPTLATRVRFASPEEWPKLLARLQWSSCGEAEAASCSKLEQFSAEQNLECMIAAEEYYAKQQLEPAGSQASWNARDQHMTTTLLRVKELLDNPKVIVWAHNSHVGDSTATPTGGADFQRNETWNLGQMCRNVLDGVHIVGFYSHQGTVFAAEKWNGTGCIKELQPSLPHSFERNMHDLLVATSMQKSSVYLQAQEPSNPTKKKKGETTDSKSGFTEYSLGVYRMLHTNVKCTTQLNETSEKLSKQVIEERYPGGVFKAVERAAGAQQTIRLKTEFGDWITEFTPQHRITTHCLPVNHTHFNLPSLLPAADANGATDGAARLAAAQDVATHLLEFPMMQRWVGVQYHPDTELESHYGEVVMGRCYDTIVFVDTTTALNTDLPDEGSTVAPTAQAVKRLMHEYRAIMKEPAPNVHAHPLEDNLLEWHFVITGSQEPYLDGKYHGVLDFPPNFPMSPPSIRMLTPSGRFETNTRICMSMSDYHPELWNPAWTVQALLIGLQSFMYEESNQVGGLKASDAQRKKLAKQSIAFNMRNEIYVKYFCGEEGARNPRKKTLQEGEVKDEKEEQKPTCRFCHLPDDLVCPCACKGSSQYVHLTCLQQWQKNVLLTQSTHPSYQTKIDEVCNVCNTPFKFKAKSRREQIIEFTGKELQQRIAKGNMLVTSRHSSEKSADTVKKHPQLAADLAHWIEAVFVIVRGSTTEYVQAVNLTRQIPPPSGMRNYQSAVESLGGAIQSVEHFIGGPVQPDEACAMLEWRPTPQAEPAATSSNASGSGLLRGIVKALSPKSSSPVVVHTGDSRQLLVKKFPQSGDLYFGTLNEILGLAKQRWNTCGEASNIKVFWGYASWGSTQLLAEMARRSWGIAEDWEARGGLQGLHEGLRWAEVVDHMSIAKASEYSRNE